MNLEVVVDLERAQEVVATLESIDMSAVDRRLVKQGRTSDFVGGLKKETLRFLGITVAGNGTFAPSKTVDDYWHELVLNTPLYAKASEAMGTFVHHRPSDGPEQEAYARTLEAYRTVFGEPNSSYWKEGEAADCPSACSGGYCTTCTNN